jgi:hypothetical protein
LSSDGLFKPVDVAELSAKLDQLSSELWAKNRLESR